MFFDSTRKLNSYSEKNEDILLLILLKVIYNDISQIRYLEIGTNHPIFGNNSYLLYQHGARGTLIDPLPWVEAIVSLCRPYDNFIQTAVTDYTNALKTKFFTNEDDSPISSLSPKWVESFFRKPKEIEVPILGINSLFEKIGYAPDLLLIDAEGEDLKILKGIDYTRNHPSIIIAELNDKSDFDKATAFMAQKNYALFANNQLNPIFISKDGVDKLANIIGV